MVVNRVGSIRDWRRLTDSPGGLSLIVQGMPQGKLLMPRACKAPAKYAVPSLLISVTRARALFLEFTKGAASILDTARRITLYAWMFSLWALEICSTAMGVESVSTPPPLSPEIIGCPGPGSSGEPRLAPETKAVSQAYSMERLDNKQKLAVGDRISLRIVEDLEEPISQLVTDTGEIHVPELGLVGAAGKTCLELARELKGRLEQTAYFQATVIIGIEAFNKSLSGRKVFVTGEVRMTGPLEIPAGETWTVSKIILRAGGFTEFADKKRVRLIRRRSNTGPNQTIMVNVSDIWEKGVTSQDMAVETEDLIYVPARAINF